VKIALVGEDFSSRSTAVSAQTCINVFPALIDDPNESAGSSTASGAQTSSYNSLEGKNKGVLYGCPGKHLFSALAAPPRGLWSGGGRCFVVVGLQLMEISSSGSVISSNTIGGGSPPTNDGLPVGIFVNGDQMMIVTGGFAYCVNDGIHPVLIDIDNSAGVVDAFGTSVEWVSGDQFTADGSWVGKTIVINGANYTISATPNPPTSTVLFTTAPVSVLSPPAYAYSVAGYPLTAVCGAYMDETFFVQRPPGPGPGGTPGQNLGAQVNFSAVLDGTTWSGIDYFTKESYADNLRLIFVDNEQMYLMGTETFEVWSSDPNAQVDGNPFARLTGASGRYGTVSTWGMDHIDGHIFFVGGDDHGGVVAYVFNGFVPVRISNHAMEAEWAATGMGPNCVVYAYMEEGHSFFVINFGAQTWAYEAETGAWHQRAKGTVGAFTAYKTNLHTFIQEWGSGTGLHITACSNGSNNLYQTSAVFYDDEGSNIAWQRALPYLYNAGKWMFFGRMDLDLEVGTGTTPVITFDYSDNRGVTYPNARASANGPSDAGASADRVFWLRNGKSRGRIIRLSGTGQQRVALVDLECDVVMGTV
jgi:hypothetical protein